MGAGLPQQNGTVIGVTMSFFRAAIARDCSQRVIPRHDLPFVGGRRPISSRSNQGKSSHHLLESRAPSGQRECHGQQVVKVVLFRRRVPAARPCPRSRGPD